MRSLLGRTAAIAVAGCTLLVGASVVAAGSPAPSDFVRVDDTTTTSTPSSTSTTSAPSTTTTSVAPTTTSTTTTSTTTTSTTTSTTTTTTSTTTTTTTTVPPLIVAEIPNRAAVTPSRGTQAQVAETLPPPPTTTTTTLPPAWALPDNSGTGRRVVYSKSKMRVWTVEDDGRVSKTHLVSGRRDWDQPTPGTYSVFSRSSYTCNINNPHICWRYMVRFAKGPGGDNIGFHEIPTNLRTGAKLQSESQLGQALSGGCVRQATGDAQYMWDWAPIGTKVVVLP